MSTISKNVSAILDIYIQEGKWKAYIDPIDRSGEPTKKHGTAILFFLCEEMEKMQKQIADIQFQQEEKIQAEEKKSHASANKTR